MLLQASLESTGAFFHSTILTFAQCEGPTIEGLKIKASVPPVEFHISTLSPLQAHSRVKAQGAGEPAAFQGT